MKCRGCGHEVANIGELTKHKKECPAKEAPHVETMVLDSLGGRASATVVDGLITEITLDYPKPEAPPPQADYQALIPLSLCPPELRYLFGQYRALRVEGLVTPEGLVIKGTSLL